MKQRNKLKDISVCLYTPNIEGKLYPEIVAKHKFEKAKKILELFWNINYEKESKVLGDEESRKASNDFHQISRELRKTLNRPCSFDPIWCQKIEKRVMNKLLNYLDKYHE